MAKVAKCFHTILALISEPANKEACLEFKYRLTKDGYARLKTNEGQNILAHRFVYCWENGISKEAIAGLTIMHKCDNPCCVNINHLNVGTWAENNKDRAAKGRSAVFVHARRALTDEQVREIRRRYSPIPCSVNGVAALARAFGVDTNTIYKVVQRRGYQDVI